MNKTFRSGVEVGAAFQAASKRLKNPSLGAAQGLSRSPRAFLKRGLRSIARRIYHLIKPIARPIAFRARGFLLEGMRHEVVPDIRKGIESRLERGLRQNLVMDLQAALEPRFVKLEQQLSGGSDGAFVKGAQASAVVSSGARRVLERALRAGELYVDVGSRIGLQFAAVARAAKGQARLIAIEPFEPYRRVLESALWMNGLLSQVEILPARASASPRIYLREVLSSLSKIHLLRIDAARVEFEEIQFWSKLLEANSGLAVLVDLEMTDPEVTGSVSERWIAGLKEAGLTHRIVNRTTGELEIGDGAATTTDAAMTLFFAQESADVWERVKP